MIYGYCRAAASKQIELGYLEEQEDLIKERYYDSIIFKESSLDMNVKPEFEKITNPLNPEDILVVTQLDRFATSIGDAVDIIASIRDKQASIHILNIGLVDFSILGNILFKTLCAVNNFDKALLVERIQSGKNKAKKTSGFKEGRPKKFSEEQIQEALDMLNSYSYKKVEELTGISKSTLIRAKKQAIK